METCILYTISTQPTKDGIPITVTKHEFTEEDKEIEYYLAEAEDLEEACINFLFEDLVTEANMNQEQCIILTETQYNAIKNT